MTQTVPFGAALTLAVLMLLLLPDHADAGSGRRSRNVCVPVYIEGAGTMLLCPPNRGR